MTEQDDKKPKTQDATAKPNEKKAPEEKTGKERELERLQQEDVELQRYMDLEEQADELTEKDHLSYLQDRYENIQDVHHALLLQKRELEARGSRHNRDEMGKIQQAAADNYKARKWVVKELRRLGKPIKDKYVL